MEETEYVTKEEFEFLRQNFLEALQATQKLGRLLIKQMDVSIELATQLSELERRVDKLS